MARLEDEALRRLALGRLGAFAPPLAREALETGVLEVEADVLAWAGSTGTVHGHRIVLAVEPGLCAGLEAAPASVDALTAAVAAAVAETPGSAMVELALEGRASSSRRASAYRGRV